MFLTDAALLNDLADTLQKPEGGLAVYWTNILSQSHSWAYGIILQSLIAKGYTVAQIAAWDYGADWERNLTLWASLRRGAALQPVDDRLLGTLDVRKDLSELQGLIIGGVYQYPAGDPGTVGIGDADNSQDIFVLSPSDTGNNEFPGPGRGQATGF